jgi:hypothetical protein
MMLWDDDVVVLSMEQKVEEIWVSTSEAAKMTGYNQNYLQKLARENWNLPEAERTLKILKRSHGYEIWLPDLIKHIENPKS